MTMQSDSIGGLFSQLTNDLQTLVRQEIALAKTEAKSNLKRIAWDSGVMLGGVFLIIGSLLALELALISLIALMVPYWAAALIVAAALLVIGAAIAMKARRSIMKASFALPRTAISIQEDTQWIKEQIA